MFTSLFTPRQTRFCPASSACTTRSYLNRSGLAHITPYLSLACIMSHHDQDFIGEACRPALAVSAFSLPSIVRVRHPGYADDDNILFKADAYTVDAHGIGWVLRQPIQDILMGFTGNVEVGFINCSREPQGRIVTQEYLRAGRNYYFHLGRNEGTEPKLYAVIPFFRQLPFDPTHLGPGWRNVSQSQKSENFLAGECIMSGGMDGIHKCHVVPQSEQDFWIRNQLADYASRVVSGSSGYGTMDENNIINLESTLHEVMDRLKTFFIYPWKGEYRVLFFGRSTRLARAYHGRALRDCVDPIPPEYFYLRMMFNAFQTLQNVFLFYGKARLVRDENGQEVTKTGSELLKEQRTQSASISLRKRKNTSLQSQDSSRSQFHLHTREDEEIDSGIPEENRSPVQTMNLKRTWPGDDTSEDESNSVYEDKLEYQDRLKRKFGPNCDIRERGRMLTRELDAYRRRNARQEKEAEEFLDKRIKVMKEA